jgi:hypothetical protein
METKIENGKLIISIPISPARPSASGKTMVVATTGGFAATTVLIDSKPVRINVTATIPK